MKNLVTGATGFIGSHIAERLINEGEEVVALVRETRIKFLSLNLDFDISKTKNELGYVPQVSIEEGLRRTKDWIEKRA